MQIKHLSIAFLFFFLPLCAENASLHREIDKIVHAAGPHVHVGIEIVSLKTGACLYEKNAKQLFVPASCLKLFTAGAALSQLGPDFCFETKLLIDGEVTQGTLRGNLYLQGSGDPTFTL